MRKLLLSLFSVIGMSLGGQTLNMPTLPSAAVTYPLSTKADTVPHSMHGAGLIDEMILTYIPSTLGAGIPLFRSNESMSNWKNIATKTYPNGLVQMHLAKA